MGLYLNYELALPASTTDANAAALVRRLHERAIALPLPAVSSLVRFDQRRLAGPWPASGLSNHRLEDVAHVAAWWAREELYRRQLGVPYEQGEDFEPTEVPDDMPTVAHAFAIAPGKGCEPAAFGIARLAGDGVGAEWYWLAWCKTQYASVVSDEHLQRCHGSLVALLDDAATLGFAVEVRDETGYWESRDPRQLTRAVADMNRLVARFAGAFTDAVRRAGGDSRQIQGSIFAHPDFERLESEAAERGG